LPHPAPRPLDALRQHTRAVILTAEGCALSDALRGLAAQSSTPCEIVDDPLMAVAALTVIEREGDASERPALVLAERQIDDLDGLFAVIRTRLRRVSVWVFEADIAIEIQRGQVQEAPDAPPRAASPRTSGITPPQLRIARTAEPPAHATTLGHGSAALVDGVQDGGAFGEEQLDGDAEDPPGPSGNAVTPEELEMLLDLFEGDRGPRRDDGGGR
jgi:hypothetical protein